MADRSDSTISLSLHAVEELSRAITVEQVLTAAASWLPEFVSADRAKITVRDGDRFVARSFQLNGARDFRDDLHPVLDGSARARVLATGMPLRMEATEILRDPDPSVQRLYDQGIRHMQFLPMKAGGATIGVVGLAHRIPISMDQSTLRKLEVVCDWIGAQAMLLLQFRANTRLAETDALTGLANRSRLMRVLNGPRALHEPDSNGQVIGVIHVDLDNFKEINDSLGHAAGDAVLRNAAKVMVDAAGPADIVARIGGDEFVIATRSDPAGRAIADLARRIGTGLATPAWSDGIDVSCSASIGTALAGPLDSTADRLIGNADIALYEVKRRGRGKVCAFCEDMRAEVEHRRIRLAELRQAVDTRAFEPFFQPVQDLRTGEVTAFEILARWPHPDHGPMEPVDFIALAQEAGVSMQIDTIVRAKSLDHLIKWRTSGHQVPVLSFNASGKTLSDPDFPDALIWEVSEKGLAPADLAIEVAEADLAASPDGQLKSNMARLSKLGFSVLIDDFGTGHASMPLIRQLKVSELKLGRILTSHLHDPCAEQILRAILAMAAELGTTVTAKGVESVTELGKLRTLNCDQVQGFGISEPLKAEDVLTFLGSFHGTAPERVIPSPAHRA